jgi:hypothetical protein
MEKLYTYKAYSMPTPTNLIMSYDLLPLRLYTYHLGIDSNGQQD